MYSNFPQIPKLAPANCGLFGAIYYTLEPTGWVRDPQGKGWSQ